MHFWFNFFLKDAYNTENSLDGNSTLSCSLSETSVELIAGYQNVGCFRFALRNWRQNTLKPGLLKLSPRTIFPTTHIGCCQRDFCWSVEALWNKMHTCKLYDTTSFHYLSSRFLFVRLVQVTLLYLVGWTKKAVCGYLKVAITQS